MSEIFTGNRWEDRGGQIPALAHRAEGPAPSVHRLHWSEYRWHLEPHCQYRRQRGRGGLHLIGSTLQTDACRPSQSCVDSQSSHAVKLSSDMSQQSGIVIISWHARPTSIWRLLSQYLEGRSNISLVPIQTLVELPGDMSVTAVDVAAHDEVSGLAEGRGELTGLALWLMAERQKVHALPSHDTTAAAGPLTNRKSYKECIAAGADLDSPLK